MKTNQLLKAVQYMKRKKVKEVRVDTKQNEYKETIEMTLNGWARGRSYKIEVNNNGVKVTETRTEWL